MQRKLIEVKITDILVTGINPRKVDVKGTKFAQLVKSIETYGVSEPVHIRQFETEGDEPFELLAGERRFRAARQAGLSEIPALNYGVISDDQAMAIMYLENSFREGLKPMEKSKAVSTVLEKCDGDVAKAAVFIGRSPKWVRTHAHIADHLHPDWRKRAEHDKRFNWLSTEHLALVARLPKDTQKAVFNKFAPDEKISAAEMENILNSFTLSLDKAPFDLTSASCNECKKRSGSCAGLFVDTGEINAKDDRCLDPKCYAKQVAIFRKNHLKALDKTHPGIIAVLGEHANPATQTELEKGYGNVLGNHQYDKVAKNKKGAVPALVVNGTKKGTIIHILPREKPAEHQVVAVTAKEKKAAAAEQLEVARWQKVEQIVQERIEKMKFEDIDESPTARIFKGNLLHQLLEIEQHSLADGERDVYDIAEELNDKNEVSAPAALLELAEISWACTIENCSYYIDRAGDAESAGRIKVIGKIVGIDVQGIYDEVCKDVKA